LSQLNTVKVAEDKRTAVVRGGANVKTTINAANAARVLVLTSNCNSVSVIGAYLNAGFSFTSGMCSLSVNSQLKIRVVSATSNLLTVSATQEPDLF
jgi:hypothetical protein